MTHLLDLSAFKNSDKDNLEELTSLVSRGPRRIGAGSHEVTIAKLHEKDGKTFELSDVGGGALSVSVVAVNPEQAEQLVFLSVPLAQTFKQACSDSDQKVATRFRMSLQNLLTMGIDPVALRESIIDSNGKSVEALVGTQFTLINSWPEKKLHLEYDSDEKGHYFTTFNGERFESGELAAIIKLDAKEDLKTRFNVAIAIAAEQGYKLATQMSSSIQSSPTVDNTHINEALKKMIKVSKVLPKPSIKPVNATSKPVFPGLKKIQAPIDIPEDESF